MDMVCARDLYPVEGARDTDMVCARDLLPCGGGQGHGHGLCKRSLCTDHVHVPGPLHKVRTWSVQEIFTLWRGPGTWAWSVQEIFTLWRGPGPWTWYVQEIFTLDMVCARDLYHVEGARDMDMVCATLCRRGQEGGVRGGSGGGGTMDMVDAGVLYYIEVEDPGARVLVCARDLCPVEGGQEPTVSSPQPDDGNLMCGGHVCDVILSVGCIHYEAQHIMNTDQTSSVPVVADSLRCLGATGGGGSDDDDEMMMMRRR